MSPDCPPAGLSPSLNRRRLLGLGAGLALAACGGGGALAPVAETGADGATSIDLVSLQANLTVLPVETLSSAERTSLLAMREEEELARAVYALSAARWPQPVFANIAASEATHTAAVKTLLDRYGLPDPMAGLATGVYPTPAMQAWYDALVAQSRQSALRAVQAGLLIEETDIRDIAAWLLQVDNADIRLVYGNLLRGSRNHLRSFWKVLLQMGGSYTPQVISLDEFTAIVNSPIETG